MTAPWEIRELLRALSARGRHPAVISYGEGKTLTWDSETLARNSLRLARSLRETGLDRGARVVLWAPNSPVWISSALGILACAGVLVPVDDLADAAQLPLARAFARAVRVFPVDATYPDAALDAADRVLRAGNAQVWFPEGWRSPDGTLQRFLPGIGELLLRSGATVVPAYIGGAFAALPRHRHLPRFKRISVIFGSPYWPEALRVVGPGGTNEERIANALRAQVIALGEATGVQLQDDTAAARSPFTHP